MAWTKRQYEFTRYTIASQRQRRKMLADGYVEADPTRCGFALFDGVRQQFRKITDVQISTSGDTLYVKLGEKNTQPYAL